jgi:hypothetical protein
VKSSIVRISLTHNTIMTHNICSVYICETMHNKLVSHECIEWIRTYKIIIIYNYFWSQYSLTYMLTIHSYIHIYISTIIYRSISKLTSTNRLIWWVGGMVKKKFNGSNNFTLNNWNKINYEIYVQNWLVLRWAPW